LRASAREINYGQLLGASLEEEKRREIHKNQLKVGLHNWSLQEILRHFPAESQPAGFLPERFRKTEPKLAESAL